VWPPFHPQPRPRARADEDPRQRHLPSGRLAAFLVSDDAATITGQAISVDGGITLGPRVA
jgi:enoyl-[acyl-carrier-protein] reductase (NADH)